MKLIQSLNLLKEVIGDSFKYIFKFFIFSALLSNVFCADEKQISNDDYVSSYHSLCKDICVDLYFRDKPYLGINYKVSHNLSISAKTSLMNTIDNKVYSHRLYGFDLDFLNSETYKLIFSFDSNKSIGNESHNYSWQQVALIYFKQNIRSTFQIILDANYDTDWTSNQINLIYGIKLYKNIFLSMGLVKNISNSNEDYKGFLSINLNI